MVLNYALDLVKGKFRQSRVRASANEGRKKGNVREGWKRDVIFAHDDVTVSTMVISARIHFRSFCVSYRCNTCVIIICIINAKAIISQCHVNCLWFINAIIVCVKWWTQFYCWFIISQPCYIIPLSWYVYHLLLIIVYQSSSVNHCLLIIFY